MWCHCRTVLLNVHRHKLSDRHPSNPNPDSGMSMSSQPRDRYPDSQRGRKTLRGAMAKLSIRASACKSVSQPAMIAFAYPMSILLLLDRRPSRASASQPDQHMSIHTCVLPCRRTPRSLSCLVQGISRALDVRRLTMQPRVLAVEFQICRPGVRCWQ